MNTTEILKCAKYPTDFVVLDFETYYNKNYSLSGMSYWEYVNDKRFEVLGCGFKYFNGGEYFIWGDSLDYYFEQTQELFGKNLENITVVIQNVSFDALILQEKYNIKPKFMIDLKHLDAHFDSRRSHRLKDMAKRENLPDKGETIKFIGLHLGNFTDEQRQAMEEYCGRDCELEFKLFEILLPYLSNAETELALARHTVNLYLQPRLKFDFDLAAELKAGMEKYITDACESVGMKAKDISGNTTFTAALQAVLPEGEKVPTKYGKRPGKKMTALLGREGVIPAFAKTDDGCKMLLAHPDSKVRNLMEARQTVKSLPLHIKRIDAMTRLATACEGWLPVPLVYYGCHTGRFSGGGGINLQNLGGGKQGTHPLIRKMRELLYV